MEHGKQPIGKERAKKLAEVLQVDDHVLLELGVLWPRRETDQHPVLGAPPLLYDRVFNFVRSLGRRDRP